MPNKGAVKVSAQNRIEIKYESWDEAFRALIPVIRQQSVRVASYTQVLFEQAIASSCGKGKKEWKERMQGQYTDLAYKCGLYHQLGKALLAPKYQLWCKAFSKKELALYQTYPAKGRLLIATLQQKGKKKGIELPTKNIAWLMLREACEQHMERWDGTGYPNGLKGEEISPIAQIVGLAKELDRLASEIKSENPFDEAIVELKKQAGKKFSPELIEVLYASKGKCRGVYRKYIQYTQTFPKTIPLVDKSEERHMGLKFRSIGAATYEAIPWFAGVLGEPEKQESLKVLEPMLIRTKMVSNVMFYLLYEAADTVFRMQNCRLQNDGVLLALPAGFYMGDSKKEKLEQLYMDQPIDRSKLLLGVPVEFVREANKMERENLTEYIESGIQLVLINYHPDELSFDQIQEIGFSKVRFAPDVNPDLRMETENLLLENAVTCLGYGVEGTELEEEPLIQELLLGDE